MQEVAQPAQAEQKVMGVGEGLVLELKGRDLQGCPEQGLNSMMLRENNVSALSGEGYPWFPGSNTDAQYILTQHITLPVENVTIQMVRMYLLTIKLGNYAVEVETKNPTDYYDHTGECSGPSFRERGE